jgi:hypothetical protein
MKKLIIKAAIVLSMLGFTALPTFAGTGGGPFVGGFLRGTLDNDHISGVGRALNGDVVVCGWTDGYEVWDNVSGYDTEQNGSIDAFVAVLSPNLEIVKAFTFLGGASDDKAIGVTIAPSGIIVIAGNTESVNLPTTIGAFSVIKSGYVDGFVASFTSDLSTLLACTYFGGTNDDEVADIVSDEAGNVFFCGSTKSVNGFPVINGYDKIYDGGYDAFLAGLTPGLSTVIFSTYYGGTSDDVFNDVAINNSGSLACVGTTKSQDFPTFPKVNPLYWWWQKERPYDWTYNGGETDGVFTVFGDEGARVMVASYFGGAGEDEGKSIALNSDGEVTIFGTTTSVDIPATSGAQGYLRGPSDVFIAQFNATGMSLTASTYLGGEGGEIIDGAVPFKGDQFVLYGTTTSQNLQTVGSGSRSTLNGGLEPFVTITSVTSISMLSTIGGSKDEHFTRALIDGDGGVIFVGSSTSPFINIDNKILEAVGEYPATDALSIRYQRGVIDLYEPRGGEHLCLDQPVNVAWSKIDMDATDKLRVEATTDLETWFPVSAYTNGSSIQVTISDSSLVNRPTTFRVVSSRSHASRMSSPLTIDPRMDIVTSPIGTTLCAGDSYQLGVEARGTGLKYIWLKDGNVIPGQTQPLLSLGPVGYAASGRYQVTVTAACGLSKTSDPANVLVAASTEIVSVPRDTTVYQGQGLELSVIARGDALSYSWYRNNVLIPFETTSKLTIASITGLDAGAYFVRVSGTCGEKISEEFKVIVQPGTSVGEDHIGQIAMYPNPAFEEVLISTPSFIGTVKLVDQLGSEITSMEFSSEVTNIRIDLSRISAGRYTIVLMPTNRPSIFLGLLVVR